LKYRGFELQVEAVVPIATADFPTKGKRPGNFRLELSRLRHEFGVIMPRWRVALAQELDDFVAAGDASTPR